MPQVYGLARGHGFSSLHLVVCCCLGDRKTNGQHTLDLYTLANARFEPQPHTKVLYNGHLATISHHKPGSPYTKCLNTQTIEIFPRNLTKDHVSKYLPGRAKLDLELGKNCLQKLSISFCNISRVSSDTKYANLLKTTTMFVGKTNKDVTYDII